MRPNPERARLLAQRGYCAAAIVEHMNEEGREVTPQEVRAWIDYREPPQMVEYRGERVTLSSVARAENIELKTLRRRIDAGMDVEAAIHATRALAPLSVIGRHSSAASPWRKYPSCARRTA